MSIPSELKLHKQSNILAITFSDGQQARLTGEFLRVHSPSAEVQGHGPGQEVLQVGKESVTIEHIEAVGNYAVRLIFSDRHDSGLFTWDYLYNLSKNHTTLWQEYLEKLQAAGHQRQEPTANIPSVGKYKP